MFHIKWIGLSIFITTIALFCTVDSLPCNLRKYSTGYVCVCNATYCDTLEDVNPSGTTEYVLVSSSKGGLRFNVTKGRWRVNDEGNILSNILVLDRYKRKKIKTNDNNETRTFSYRRQATISVNPNRKYQKIVGFGGALTGTVSHNLDQLSDNLKNNIYKSYYSLSEGIGYNMIRMPIGGCDFDLSPWAYNESPVDDTTLSNFTKLDDRELTIIQKIENIKKVTNNNDIKLMGAAWSSPPWMKTNGRWTGASALKKEYYQTWADYHLKYLELMAENNVTFWAISTGNEPMNGVIGWLFVHFMSLGWTAPNQGRWVGNNLGPTIKNSKFKNVKIFAGDDQRYTFPWWFTEMDKAHEGCLEFIDGLAVHWYWDTLVPPQLLDRTYNLFPDKIFLNTESCVGDRPFQTHGPVLGSWARGELYISAFMQDLKHWINGWIDWNLLLDEIGGPNYAKNYVEAPIIINADLNEAYKQPIFYAIGHFSRFLTPNSVRIEVESDNSDIDAIGFKREDNSVVIIFYNRDLRSSSITIEDPTGGPIEINVPAKSIHTFIYIK